MLALALTLSLAAVPESVTLELGESITLDVGGVQRLAVSAGCYDVRPVAGGKLMIIGAELGESTVLGWRGDGSRFSFGVRVVAATRKRRDEVVPVHRTELKGGRDGGGDLTIFEVPVELRTITETVETDGGVVVLGTGAHGERLRFELTPR